MHNPQKIQLKARDDLLFIADYYGLKYRLSISMWASRVQHHIDDNIIIPLPRDYNIFEFVRRHS